MTMPAHGRFSRIVSQIAHFLPCQIERIYQIEKKKRIIDRTDIVKPMLGSKSLTLVRSSLSEIYFGSSSWRGFAKVKFMPIAASPSRKPN